MTCLVVSGSKSAVGDNSKSFSMPRHKTNIPRDIIIVYVETIPTLTFTSWYPGQSRGSVASSNQSDLSIDLYSQSDKASDNIDIGCLSVSNINIDQYLMKDKHTTLESSFDGALTHADNKSDLESELDYAEGLFSDMSTESHWEYSHHQKSTKPQDCSDIPCLDIVIEDYSSQTILGKLEESSTSDLNHNTMKCIDLLDYGNMTSNKKWIDSQSELTKDKLSQENGSTIQTNDEKTKPSIVDDFKYTKTDSKLSDPELSETLSPNDFEKLKSIATRLNLQTRRGSYTMWRNKLAQATLEKKALQQSQTDNIKEKSMSALESHNQSDEEKLRMKPKWIGETLAFIRSELVGITSSASIQRSSFLNIGMVGLIAFFQAEFSCLV